MAAMQNIGADNAGDSFYRYKMPILQAKIEGRGNGIKTNVVNNVDIAKALDRPPTYIIKFFGCELGALTSYDAKTGMSIVNGAHDSKKLAALLEVFIKKYVQCHSCGNPETRVKIRKECIYLQCKACGATSNVDMRHKVNNYILKNPPEEKLSKEEKKLRKQEKERMKGSFDGHRSTKPGKEKEKEERKDKKKKDKKKTREEDGKVEAQPSKEDSDGAVERTSSNVQSDEGKALADGNEAANESDDNDDAVVWHTDTSEDAMRKRAEGLSAAAAALITQGNVAAEKAEAKRAEKKALAKLGFSSDDVSAIFEIRKLLSKDSDVEVVSARLKELSGKPAVRMQLLAIALFGGDSSDKIGTVVKNNAAFLEAMAPASKDRLALLIAIEYFLGAVAPERVKEVVEALNIMYESKFLAEDLIIAWYDRPSAGIQALGVSEDAGKLVRDRSKRFVEWLKEAEEEDDDEDEEDEDEDDEEDDDASEENQ